MDLPRVGANGSDITLDWKVFLFILLISVLIGILCALVPAVQVSRTNIGILVKESVSQSGMSFRRNPWRSTLMIGEISLSLILLAGAGLMIRTLVAKRAVNRGFDKRNVLTLEMSLNSPRFDETIDVAQLVRHAEIRIKGLEGVQAIATTCALPLIRGLPMPFIILKNDHSLIGRYDGTATWRSVSPEYFKVFQIRMLRGRQFTSEDDGRAAPVVLINQAMLKQYWREVDANPIGDFISVGKGLEPGPGDAPRQIVGVVADVRDAGLDREPSMYVPVAQVSSWMNARNNRLMPMIWAIRTDATRPVPVSRIQQELAGLSGGQPIGRPRTMHEAIAASSARTQFYMTLFTVFAGIALVLTGAGLYGLIAYSVQLRGRELAIRIALGATPLDVQEMVVGQALRLALSGTLAGIPLALAAVRVTISLIFGIQTWDPAMLALVASLLSAVSIFAAYVPAVRASRVNPAMALRSET